MERPFSAYSGDEPYVFVSYDHEDARFVYPELTRLKDQGFNIWYDEGIAPGASWRDEVAQALSRCTAVLYFVSPRSVASSNCRKELNYALSRERRVLAVHLERTELPPGLELSLSDMQAVMREDHGPADFAAKVSAGLGALLGDARAPAVEPASVTRPAAADEAPLTAIAVLPFMNRSADPDNEYLCDGIAETLIDGLSEIEPLQVASHLSAFTFKGRSVGVAEVGAALGVGSVVSGVVQKSGQRLRIRVSLDRARDGVTLWSHQYDMQIADLFDVQDDVARQVVDALKIELKPQDGRKLIDVGTDDPEAYNLYMLGNYELQRFNHSGLTRAAGFYEQAVRRDDGLAEAHWRLGLARLVLMQSFGVPVDELLKPARQAFGRARQLGFSPYRMRLWNGPSYTWDDVDEFLADPAGADGAFTPSKLARGITLLREPDDPRNRQEPIAGVLELRSALVNLRLFRANHDLLVRFGAAERGYDYELGDALTALGRYEEAVPRYTAALERDPQHHFARHARALDRLRAGQLSLANEDLELLVQVWPKGFDRFLHDYWSGDVDAARAHFVEHFAHHPRFEARLKVVAWTMLGEIDEALDALATTGPHLTMPIPYNLKLYAPEHCIERLAREPAYQVWLERVGMSDAHREDARRRLNEIAHLTGVTVDEP